MSVTASVLTQLQEHMRDESVNIFFKDSKQITPILAHAEMRSDPDGFGRGYIQRIKYSTGFNASFGDTIPTAVASGRDRWVVTAITINMSADWTRDDIDAAKGDGEKFDVISDETDSKTVALRDLIASQLTGRGWGSLGTVLAVNASPAYFDTQPSRVGQYKIGMSLRTSDDEATSALDGTALTVSGVDFDLGRVFVSASPAGASWDVGDHVFVTGSREDAGPPTSRLCLTGLLGWVDSTAPSLADASPAALYGVTRTGKWELSGHRINAASLDHEQALIRAASRIRTATGTNPDTAFVSPADWEILAADKSQVKTVAITNAGKYEISFEAITVLTTGGPIKVVQDPYVPQGTAWVGPFENRDLAPYLVYSGDSLVNIDDKDGNPFRRKASAIGYEMLLYTRCQYVVPGPGHFAVVYNLPS